MHFFDSFNNSFNRTAKIFIQRIYSFKKNNKKIFIQRIHSFKKNKNYSLKEFIHSIKSRIIHSKDIFIQVKNGLSPRATFRLLMILYKPKMRFRVNKGNTVLLFPPKMWLF